MIARDRRRAWMGVGAAVAAVGIFGSGTATGQQGPADGRVPVGNRMPPKPANSTPTKPEDDGPPVEGRIVRVPTNPNDPVAVVNGETITRAQLAEESFIRKGDEVLDAMISRKLLDQAMKVRKITVTPQEVDAEIDKYANNVAGVTREEWLRNLAKERKISSAQYKNDIIFPGLALKKLAENRVQVTEKDMKEAFEAHYGDQLRCRLIMTLRERDAVDIWNELKANPAGFAKMAMDDKRSVDQSTRANGGLLEQPLTRHAYPREVSDRAFAQLVDGDPQDKDPTHKPKDGDITGPIQVTPETWIIMKREGLMPAKQYNPKDESVRKMMHNAIFDAKLKEEMSAVFKELVNASNVDNKLTGQVKTAHEDRQPESRMDKSVQLMSDPGTAIPKRADAPATTRGKATSAAVKPEDRATADSINKTATSKIPSQKK